MESLKVSQLALGKKKVLLELFKPCYLHAAGYAFSLTQDFMQCFGSKNVSQSSLG